MSYSGIYALESKYKKYGVKFIDSNRKKTAYAIDDERKGVVMLTGGEKTFIPRDIMRELKDIYEVFFNAGF